MKKCSKCGEIKGFAEFSKHSRSRDKLQNYCKPCNKRAASDWEAVPENHRARKLRSRYNLTLKDYNSLLELQDGKCKICGSTSPRNTKYTCLVVDHCHKTGVIRGLLCDPCNNGLGRFDDNVEVLQKAIEYLTKTYTK